MLPVVLRTARLELSPPTLADADAITGYCRDPLFERMLTTPWPYEREHATGFVTEVVEPGWRDETEYTWALRREGALVGVIGARAALRDVGYWVGAPHRRLGYLGEALPAVCRWLLEDRGWDLVRWEAVVGNHASAAAARAVGFRFTGVAPVAIQWRDGSHPDGWHAELRPADLGTPHGGWPA